MLRQVFSASLRARIIPANLTRRLLSERKFPSILQDSNVASPFADPSRTRKSSSTTTLESQRVPTSPNTTADAADKKEIHISGTVTADIMKPPVEAGRSDSAKAEGIDNSTNLKQEQKLSALEELASLKESVEKLKQQEGGDSGSKAAGDEDFHDEEAEKRRERMARNTKIGMAVVFGTSVAGFIGFCMYYGRAERDEAGNVIEDEFSQAGFFAPFYRIANSVKLWRDYVVEPAREKLLPDPMRPPYIQPKYTLVIEMKNVLVAPEWTYKTGYRFVKRPALDYFLDVVGYPNFEVVIYSSESNFTGPAVVETFDPKQRIMFKLFRDCTKYMNGVHVKDLSKLNRDLSKVIFIDFDPAAFQLNPENVLRVPKWDGDMNDTSLVDLAELLKTIHLSDTEDVRPTLQYYSQYDNPMTEFRKRAMYLAEQEEQRKHQGQEQSLLSRYSGRLFGFRRHASV